MVLRAINVYCVAGSFFFSLLSKKLVVIHTCTMRFGGGMFPGRELKLTPTPPSWWAASLGSSSSSREMRDRVPVMVAGLQVFTSLNITGKRCGEAKEAVETARKWKTGKSWGSWWEQEIEEEVEEHLEGERWMDIELKWIHTVYCKRRERQAKHKKKKKNITHKWNCVGRLLAAFISKEKFHFSCCTYMVYSMMFCFVSDTVTLSLAPSQDLPVSQGFY